VEGFFFGFIVFAAMVFIAVTISAGKRRQTVESYSQLAQHYKGTCDPGGWSSRPKVRFPHGDCLVIIDVYSTGGKNPTYYTQAHFTGGRQSAVRCEIYPESMWSGIRKLLGMQDIEIGSPDFDSKYIIKGDDGPALRSLLSPAVQWKIELLRQILGNNDIYISFNRRELLVKKRSFLRDYSTLLWFTDSAIGLYDQAVRAGEEGIKFIHDASPLKLSEAICQICGEKIEEDVVFCRRCRTPHHQDCWEYNGACSTYGCRETQYMRPQSRRAQRAQKKMAR
jgi:hypothetical protein